MTAPKPLPDSLTVELLREILNYDPQTGIFAWRVTHGGARAGEAAGWRCEGYIRIGIEGRAYRAHRLAWLYSYGEWPPDIIDHIDRDPSNNRLENLRLATRSQNNGNRRLSRNNKSGVKGVYWDKAGKQWQAMIHIKDGTIYLGRYRNIDDASNAYAEAARQHFGEFANCERTP